MSKKLNLKAKHKSKKGGLTDSGRAAYNRATGSNLKRPQPEGGSRKKSYCARSKGQMNDHNIDCSKTPDKRICLARKRWKCNKSLQKSDMVPKAKLAAFLREHLDNKLALKAAEPTITKSNELVGGKGDTKDISDFDPKQVQMGLKIELEHTDNIEVAKEIVADHLSEDPAYYSKLKGSGLADELKKAISFEQQKENIKKQRELQNKQVVSELKGKPHRGSSIPPPTPLFIPTKDSPGVPIYLKTHPDHDNLINGNHVNFGEASLDEVFNDSAIAHVLHQAKSRGMSFDTPIYVGIDKIKESKNSQLAPASAPPKTSHLQVIKSLEKAGRCWEGYEPTPGKKPYSKGSCRKIKKSDGEASLKLINQFEGSSINPAEYHYAVHKDGNEIGRAIVFDKDPKSIHNAGKKGASLKDIRLKSEHQGKGLSGHIINQLVNTHGPLASDSRGNISEAGAKMFAKYGTKQLDNSYVLGGDMKKSAKENLIKALACKGEKLSKSISAMAIESGEYQGETLDSHHHNRIGQEYRGMAKQAFTEGKKVKAREYHAKALKHFQMADKMGFQAEEPLEKKISDKLRTLGVGAAAALGSIATPTQTSTFADKPPATEKKLEAPPVAPEKITKLSQLSAGNPLHMFLWNVAQKESSGGTDTNHSVIEDPESIHYGMRAIGNFALMPLTVQEFTNRYRQNGGKDPRILKILKMNAPSGEINTYLEKNPDIEFELAGNAAKHVLKTHGYTPEAAYAWKYGHNKTAQSVKSPESQAKMKSDSYVIDFKELMEGGSPKNLTPATKMPKPTIN